MTDETMIALGRRAVACKGWRWMGGMRRVWPFLVQTPILQGNVWSCFASDEDRARGYSERMPTERVEDDPLSREPLEQWDDANDQWVADIPDLRDPATLGCVLALVREAHAVPFLQVSVKISREHGYQFDCHPHHRGQWVDTEAEAIVAALEAAP